jgi:hypothetical protein
MKAKTAVEWLVEQLAIKHNEFQALTFYYDHKDEIAQAKAMEKEQMIEFANEYADSGSFYCNGEFAIEIDAEQYYNETYKK